MVTLLNCETNDYSLSLRPMYLNSEGLASIWNWKLLSGCCFRSLEMVL